MYSVCCFIDPFQNCHKNNANNQINITTDDSDNTELTVGQVRTTIGELGLGIGLDGSNNTGCLQFHIQAKAILGTEEKHNKFNN